MMGSGGTNCESRCAPTTDSRKAKKKFGCSFWLLTLTAWPNSIRFESNASVFLQLTESTTLQRRALELLSTHA
jgi:hypothetical protein